MSCLTYECLENNRTRIYYEWLRAWGIPTSINRTNLSEMDAWSHPSPYGSNYSATPGSVTTPYNQLHEVYEPAPVMSPQSSLADIANSSQGGLLQGSSHHPNTITIQGEEGCAKAYEAIPGPMDLDDERDPLSSNVRTATLAAPSQYHHRAQLSAQGHQYDDSNIRQRSAQHGSSFDDSDRSDEGEDFDYSRTTTKDNPTQLSSTNATLFPLVSTWHTRGVSPSTRENFAGLPKMVIHQSDSLMSEQIAFAPAAHRSSSDSGYGSKKGSIQSSMLEYSSSSRPPSSLRNSVNQEANDRGWTFGTNLLHSVSCPVNHKGMDFNFNCCGSSCLQELANFAMTMQPLQVYERLSDYMRFQGVRLWDHAGNTFLHKLAVTGAPWEYFVAGFNARIDPCHRNGYGQTFAHVLNVSAFHNNLIECLASLQALGVDFCLRDASGRTILHCLYAQPILPDTARQILNLIDVPGRQLSLRDVSGRTPCEIFKHTFVQEASVNPRWSTTESQLQMLGIFEDIVDGGVLRLNDENVDWSNIAADSLEALRAALQNQYTEVIDNAKNGIAVEAVDGSNAFHAQAALTTIHNAATDLSNLEKFISVGIDANDYDKGGRTPLEAIITQPRDYETELTTSEKVSLLIDMGKASVHSRNRLGHTPLYSAAIRGLDRTVEALLRRHSCTNIRANDGQSLLQAVIDAGHRAFVEYYESGYCRYHEAQCSRIEECKVLLERHGAVPDPTPAQSMGYVVRRSPP